MNFVRYLVYSVLLHALAGGLLIVSLDLTPVKTIKPVAKPQIVEAVAVDNKQVEAELQRLKDIENEKIEKQKALEKRLKELEQKRAQTERRRKEEEKKLSEAKRKKAREEAKRKEEQKKIAQLQKEKDALEKKRKEEEEKKRKAEEERKRLEKEAAERKRREEERKRREAELAEEQRLLEAEQMRQDQLVINQFGLRIQQSIIQSFNTTGLPPGLSCVLQIRMIPGGEVIEARVVRTSGNDIFDRRAETAVNKASPLPVPNNPRLFEKMRELRLTFAPQN